MSMIKRLSGVKDARSTVGILSRGANVYNAGSSSAHGGIPAKRLNPGKGASASSTPKPTAAAIQRRMRKGSTRG